MRQVLCPVLVGREDELQVLLDALDGAVAGRGGTAVVLGEAGAGKSRMVRELAGAASARGLPVPTGRAAVGVVPMAFRPLAEAVLGELRHHRLPDLPELRPFRPALGRLVPEWRPREPVSDAESLVVLEYLADNLATERILCLATLPPGEGDAGRGLAGALAARHAAAIVPLERLHYRQYARRLAACRALLRRAGAPSLGPAGVTPSCPRTSRPSG